MALVSLFRRLVIGQLFPFVVTYILFILLASHVDGYWLLLNSK